MATNESPKQNYFDANEEEEFSNATAGALCGEILLDSPDPDRLTYYYSGQPMRVSEREPPKQSSMPEVPSLHDATSVGIMAQGLAWVQTQREKRRRKYLQMQADRQIEKIRLAQEQQRNRHLSDNTVFQNLKEIPSEDSTNDGKTCNLVSQSGDGVTVQLYVEDEEDESFVPPVRIENDEEETELSPFLLNESLRQQIAHRVLPRQIAYARWTRLYSLVRDGDSFDNFLRRMQNQSPTLIVVRTDSNELIGGFADSVWEPPGLSGAQYYGGTTSCLYRVKDDSIVCYKWTGANRYIQLCDPHKKMIALGGGDGAFGLALEQDFQKGSSGPCATFGNDQLCEKEQFDILDVEVFGFLTGQF